MLISLVNMSFFYKRLCLSLLGRLAGSERERLLKQAEIVAPGESAERREEMEVAMQQVRQKKFLEMHYMRDEEVTTLFQQ